MTSDAPPLSDPVAEWKRTVPPELRGMVERLLGLIHRVAHDSDASPLVQEIKWGQPSFRSPHGNESTPLRVGITDDGDVALLAHCQSSVIPEFRAAHEGRFRFDGNRAVLLARDHPVRDDDLAELIQHALTYRRI